MHGKILIGSDSESPAFSSVPHGIARLIFDRKGFFPLSLSLSASLSLFLSARFRPPTAANLLISGNVFEDYWFHSSPSTFNDDLERGGGKQKRAWHRVAENREKDTHYYC